MITVDSNRTLFLHRAAIIADVRILDTSQFLTKDASFPKLVVVTAIILDGMKGKYVPRCPSVRKAYAKEYPDDYYRTSADTILALPGTTFQFEYRPHWFRGIVTDVMMGPQLTYSSGDWIKKDSEYVVFLDFVGVTSDGTNLYYALQPEWGSFGSVDGLYPVRDGLVYDPNDDFGLGAFKGLALPEWKSRLRARIQKKIVVNK